MTLPFTLLQGAYIIAGLFFILALAGLSKHETAKAGNTNGVIGMGIALIITLFAAVFGVTSGGETVQEAGGIRALLLILGPMAVGAVIGVIKAKKVEMTGMPELIAMLHSFVGLAAVLVGWNSFYAGEGGHHGIHMTEVFAGVFIGAVTFTGSIVAYLKLSAKMKSAPLVLPGRHIVNLGIIVAFFVMLVTSPGCTPSPGTSTRRRQLLLGILTVLALFLGWHLVASIGGGDMPVVVSMLNSYSGWAAAAAGFLLNNDLLIITGALVGSSGAYLSYIMCRAMNRSFISVIAGGFGSRVAPVGEAKDYGEHRETTPRWPTCSRTPTRSSSPPGTGWPRPGAVRGRGPHPQACASSGVTCASASTRSPVACPVT
jgi:NAD(P) transhydrogenase subunit beta